MDEYIKREDALDSVLFALVGTGYQSKAIYAIRDIPTADVAPKSKVDNLEYTLMGVMHSVDKWLEGDELKQDEVNRAITMREKILRIIENANTEVAREIFEEIEQECDINGNFQYWRFLELKKKHGVNHAD